LELSPQKLGETEPTHFDEYEKQVDGKKTPTVVTISTIGQQDFVHQYLGLRFSKGPQA